MGVRRKGGMRARGLMLCVAGLASYGLHELSEGLGFGWPSLGSLGTTQLFILGMMLGWSAFWVIKG